MAPPGISLPSGGVREPDHLRAFVRESNRIEGIARPPTKREIAAHVALLNLPELRVIDVSRFVSAIQPGAELRLRPNMNVRVGNHVAPPGGSAIGYGLFTLLDAASNGSDPYETHLRYETLHPFIDGNGRSGRAIWLWQMLRQGRDPWALKRGFLHSFYYQTLSAIPARSEAGTADPIERSGRDQT